MNASEEAFFASSLTNRYPRGKIFEPIMQAALAKGEVTPELWKQLHDPAMRRMHLSEMARVVFVVYLTVFKPF